MTRAAALLAVLALSGCGISVPMLAAVGGAAAGVARLDIAVLDTVEAWEGREAKVKGVSP